MALFRVGRPKQNRSPLDLAPRTPPNGQVAPYPMKGTFLTTIGAGLQVFTTAESTIHVIRGAMLAGHSVNDAPWGCAV